MKVQFLEHSPRTVVCHAALMTEHLSPFLRCLCGNTQYVLSALQVPGDFFWVHCLLSGPER